MQHWDSGIAQYRQTGFTENEKAQIHSSNLPIGATTEPDAATFVKWHVQAMTIWRWTHRCKLAAKKHSNTPL